MSSYIPMDIHEYVQRLIIHDSSMSYGVMFTSFNDREYVTRVQYMIISKK